MAKQSAKKTTPDFDINAFIHELADLASDVASELPRAACSFPAAAIGVKEIAQANQEGEAIRRLSVVPNSFEAEVLLAIIDEESEEDALLTAFEDMMPLG